jgi:hypothetical protein
MKSARVRILALTAAAAAALGAAAFASPVAQAQPYPPAEIGRSILLDQHSMPDDYAELPFGVPYSIDLDPGVYRWEVQLGSRNYAEEIYLAEDNYKWRCYLSGNGKLYPAINYRGNCILDPADPRAATAKLPRDGSAREYAVRGQTSWTSKLTWIRRYL